MRGACPRGKGLPLEGEGILLEGDGFPGGEGLPLKERGFPWRRGDSPGRRGDLPGLNWGSPVQNTGFPSWDRVSAVSSFHRPHGVLLFWSPLPGLAVSVLLLPWVASTPICLCPCLHIPSAGAQCPRGSVPGLMHTQYKHSFVSSFTETKAAVLASFQAESETWLVTGACGFLVLLPAGFLMWATLGRARPASLSLAARHSALVWGPPLTKLPGRKPASPMRLMTPGQYELGVVSWPRVAVGTGVVMCGRHCTSSFRDKSRKSWRQALG